MALYERLSLPLSSRYGNKAFNNLPLEIVQHIATFLPEDDTDLANFTRVCQQTYIALGHWQSGIWRYRFASIYDLGPEYLGEKVMLEYKARRNILHKGTEVITGSSKDEAAVLYVMKKLVVESFRVGTGAHGIRKERSNNLRQLRLLAQRSCILNNVHRFNNQSILKSGISEVRLGASFATQIMQLVLTHLYLGPQISNPYRFEYSQCAAYSHPQDEPMFLDGTEMQKINVNFLLHIVNFFKYHMSQEAEATLHAYFLALPSSQKPQAWTSQPAHGLQKLGRHWKGTSAYLGYPRRQVPKVRAGPTSSIFIDSIITDDDSADGFLMLSLDFSRPAMDWPMTLEKYLHSIPSAELSRQIRNGSEATPLKPKPFLDSDREVLSHDDYEENNAHVRQHLVKDEHPPLAQWAPKPGVDYHQFRGKSHEFRNFYCAGNLHALPPQKGIPGFQRISFLLWSTNVYRWLPQIASETQPARDDMYDSFFDDCSPLIEQYLKILSQPDRSNLPYAYEGIVLPGGKIMVGRWWDLNDKEERERDRNNYGSRDPREPEEYRKDRTFLGPFIYWCVDDATDRNGARLYDAT